MPLDDLLPEIDAIFHRFHESGVAPGFAYGVTIGGELVHSGGRGTLRLGADATPDADSAFRIASMTKSFTAATVLGLRDDGVLRLDDEVTRWIPELAAVTAWSRDSPAITLRHLLTMSSGLPTDDPWGDRQQDLSDEDFRAFLGAGPLLALPTGTQFEYANLGYAILGLVVARAAGEPYREAVERRILRPLALAATGYDDTHVDAVRVADGHVKRGDDWVVVPTAAHGAFASMGGLFSSVRDLAAWASWLAGAFPARDDPDDGPLARATRREMQQVHRTMLPELRWTSAAVPPEAAVWGYGYGLFVNQDVARGRVVGHSGGYPGFGSNMIWHPATGIGIVAVANGRYARIGMPCRDALNLLVDREAAPAHRPTTWSEVAAARTAVEGLLERWDDEVAAGLFAMNVELDEPIAARRSAIEKLRVVHGRLRPDDTEPASSYSAADLGWWMIGERGRVRIEILLNPQRPPRVQTLDITSVPEPPEALAAAADRIVAGLAEMPPRWPSDLVLADAVDRVELERELRATESVFGPVTLGPVSGGDGEREASWRLRGPRGDVTLTIERDPTDGTISKASLVPVTRESPLHLA